MSKNQKNVDIDLALEALLNATRTDVTTPDFQEIRNDKAASIEKEKESTSNEQIIARYDGSYNEFLSVSRRTTNERDELFNEFLAHYTSSFTAKSEQKILLKNRFFILIMIIFFIIVMIPVLEIIIFIGQNGTASFIVSIVGSFVELFTAFLVLPKIIAEYLFNKEEDKHMVTIIEKMQTYNLEKIKGEHEDNNRNLKS